MFLFHFTRLTNLTKGTQVKFRRLFVSYLHLTLLFLFQTYLVRPIVNSDSCFKEPTTLYEMQFALNGPNKSPPNSLSELYAIHFNSWPGGCKIGIVAHDFPTIASFDRPRQENKASLKLWVCVAEDEGAQDTGWCV